MARKSTYSASDAKTRGFERESFHQKASEDALQQNDTLYRTVVECSNQGVAIVQNDSHLYVNRKYMEIFGYDNTEDLVGKPLSMMIVSDDRKPKSNLIRSIQNDMLVPGRYECRGILKNGNFFVFFAATLMYKSSRQFIITIKPIMVLNHL